MILVCCSDPIFRLRSIYLHYMMKTVNFFVPLGSYFHKLITLCSKPLDEKDQFGDEIKQSKAFSFLGMARSVVLRNRLQTVLFWWRKKRCALSSKLASDGNRFNIFSLLNMFPWDTIFLILYPWDRNIAWILSTWTYLRGKILSSDKISVIFYYEGINLITNNIHKEPF